MSATPNACAHLSIDTVREIHAEAIKRFGGLNGVRDENLLASAVLTPQSSFGGKSPYAAFAQAAQAANEAPASLRVDFRVTAHPPRRAGFAVAT